MNEEKCGWIFILMAKKFPFLPSVRPMRKCSKQNFTQVLHWATSAAYPGYPIF